MTSTTELFPSLAESVLAPILIGITTTERDTEVIGEVWDVAAFSVPVTSPVLKVLVGKASQPLKHSRRVITGVSVGGDYIKLAQLCDVRGDEPAAESRKRSRWMVGVRIAPDDVSRQLVGPDRTPIRVDVMGYQLQAGRVLEAQQLALFRHYVVAGFQALDPAAVVLGGQHDWRDDWWSTAQTNPQSSP